MNYYYEIIVSLLKYVKQLLDILGTYIVHVNML